VEFKILVDQSMPVGAHANPHDQGSASTPVLDQLNANERIALVNCLEAEFNIESTKEREWAAELPCGSDLDLPTPQSGPVAPAVPPASVHQDSHAPTESSVPPTAPMSLPSVGPAR
jgi:hypothetical protein